MFIFLFYLSFVRIATVNLFTLVHFVGEKSKELDQRVEKPHEGPERAKKNGYFFHSRLNDFSESKIASKLKLMKNFTPLLCLDADKKKEDSFKFAYVYKGAKCAKQKKVYYVFGKVC